MRNQSVLLALVIALLGAVPARATIYLNAVEDAGDVVFTLSGNLNLGSVTFNRESGATDGINASGPVISMGAVYPNIYSASLYYMEAITGPLSFGTGMSYANSGSGDVLYFSPYLATHPSIAVASDYVSGAALSGTMTFANRSFATLGVVKGNYVWSWTNSTTEISDSLSMELASVPPLTAVPEPAAAILTLALGLVGFVLLRHYFRRANTRAC